MNCNCGGEEGSPGPRMRYVRDYRVLVAVGYKKPWVGALRPLTRRGPAIAGLWVLPPKAVI